MRLARRATDIRSQRSFRRWCRQQLLELSDQAARLTAAQPLPIVAPITASIEALREALELLVRRLYPAIAA